MPTDEMDRMLLLLRIICCSCLLLPQVNIVKKMMLEQGRPSEPDTDEPGRKNSRRLTWCAGRKAGWLPPAGLSESGLSGGRDDSEDATLSGGRKRSLSSLAEDGAESRRLAKAGSHQLGQLEEGDEEEEENLSGDRNGPTPQRRRRERESCNAVTALQSIYNCRQFADAAILQPVLSSCPHSCLSALQVAQKVLTFVTAT